MSALYSQNWTASPPCGSNTLKARHAVWAVGSSGPALLPCSKKPVRYTEWLDCLGQWHAATAAPLGNVFSGTPGGTRTPNLLIRNQTALIPSSTTESRRGPSFLASWTCSNDLITPNGPLCHPVGLHFGLQATASIGAALSSANSDFNPRRVRWDLLLTKFLHLVSHLPAHGRSVLGVRQGLLASTDATGLCPYPFVEGSLC